MTSLAIGFTHQYNRSTTEITEANMSKHLSIRMISEQSKSSEDLKILVFGAMLIINLILKYYGGINHKAKELICYMVSNT